MGGTFTTLGIEGKNFHPQTPTPQSSPPPYIPWRHIKGELVAKQWSTSDRIEFGGTEPEPGVGDAWSPGKSGTHRIRTATINPEHSTMVVDGARSSLQMLFVLFENLPVANLLDKHWVYINQFYLSSGGFEISTISSLFPLKILWSVKLINIRPIYR